MSPLLYREDVDLAFDRLTTWWQGGDIGRPAMLITAERAEPVEPAPVMAEPPEWSTRYSTRDFAYRVNLAARACVNTHYLGEAIPQVSPDLGPNCLALYLGCRGVEGLETVWFEPCIGEPEAAKFQFDPDNFYWDFTLRLAQKQLEIGRGKFLTSFPDLIEGLDTLAAMRNTQQLLLDLMDRPDWVHQALKAITERYFDYYDILYELIKDERGGSHFWAWAPGRMAKFQCDFSAMISPAMFKDLMVPVLQEMAARVDYCIYHWDGPNAIRHHDHLLSLPNINVIQWTPGAGVETVADRKWWPLYHKTIDAGKKVALLDFPGVDTLRTLKAEFGGKLNHFLISIEARSLREAEEILQIVSDY
jgi:5-methyltetrahydrofolate--homocysteine methyltransferase